MGLDVKMVIGRGAAQPMNGFLQFAIGIRQLADEMRWISALRPAAYKPERCRRTGVAPVANFEPAALAGSGSPSSKRHQTVGPLLADGNRRDAGPTP